MNNSLSRILLHLDSPKATALITALAYLAFLIMRLRVYGYDPSYFVAAGDQFNDPQRVPKSLSLWKNSAGYDGQFYYRLALDPFTSSRTDFGMTLDLPETRHSRIVYPLLVWLLSLGRVEAVPLLMLGVNYVALCVLGGLGGRFAQTLSQHALWGLVFPFYAGFLLTLSRDLTEILAACMLLTALLLIRRGRLLCALVWLTLAALTKETTLLFSIGALLVWCLASFSRRVKTPDYWFLVPPIAYALWLFVLTLHWGNFPLAFSSRNLDTPFAALMAFAQFTSAFQNHFQVLWFIQLCYLGAFSLAVIYAWPTSAATTQEKFSWELYAIFALSWSKFIWVEDWAYLRHLSEFHLLGAIIVLASPSRVKFLVLGGMLLLWLLMFQEIIRYR